jgi:hypothetical protein
MSSRRSTVLWLLLVAVVVALAALIVALTMPRGDSLRLGPTNAADDGSRAVVQVLRAHGVGVQPLRASRDVVASADAEATVLVTVPDLLGPEQLDRLAGDDADLVLVEPNATALARLAPDIHPAGLDSATVRPPGCTVPAAVTAGPVRAGGLVYSLADEPSTGVAGAALCYRSAGDPKRASYVVEQQQSGRLITVIGQSDVLTNHYLGRDGNAALALATLGRQPRLIWYSPNPLEPNSAGQNRSLTDLLPDWVFWVIVQLAVVVAVVMLWRGRRLGRLVPEPLPVVVRAAETQEGRARLYRQASARGRAAATLRTGTLRTLAGRLTVPDGTTPEELIGLLAAATGQDPARLHGLLLGPAPATDSALIALADDLDALEHDLTRTIDPRGSLL